MATKFGVSVLALVTAISLVESAEAQRRRGLVDVTSTGERRGFWMSVGIVGAEERSRVDGDPWAVNPVKPAGYLRIGGTVSPNLRLGGEIAGWGQTVTALSGDRVTDYLVGLSLIGQFYPSRNAGFFFKGGAGISRSGEDVIGPGDLHEDGFAWTAGIGYDIKLSRVLSLTPTLDILQHRSQIRDIDGTLLPPFYDRLGMIGVALTIQPRR